MLCHNSPMAPVTDRVLIWPELGRASVVEPDDIHWIEADSEGTWVRFRGRDRVRDRRTLPELVDALAPLGFLQVHRDHAVNLRRVAEVRRRTPGGDWEVKLEPPVNRVLPVARGREDAVLAAFGGR